MKGRLRLHGSTAFVGWGLGLSIGQKYLWVIERLRVTDTITAPIWLEQIRPWWAAMDPVDS